MTIKTRRAQTSQSNELRCHVQRIFFIRLGRNGSKTRPKIHEKTHWSRRTICTTSPVIQTNHKSDSLPRWTQENEEEEEEGVWRRPHLCSKGPELAIFLGNPISGSFIKYANYFPPKRKHDLRQWQRLKAINLSLPACPTNPGLQRTHIRRRHVFQERVEQTATGLDMRGSFRVERATDDFDSREEFSASDVRVTVLNREINPDTSGRRSRTAAVVSSKGKLKRRLNKKDFVWLVHMFEYKSDYWNHGKQELCNIQHNLYLQFLRRL